MAEGEEAMHPGQEQGSRKPMDWQLRDFWAEHGDRRGVPQGVRDLLNAAFTKVPVSSFPDLPSGRGTHRPSTSCLSRCDYRPLQIVNWPPLLTTSFFPWLHVLAVVEVPGDVSIADAVNILAQNNIFSVLVILRNSNYTHCIALCPAVTSAGPVISPQYRASCVKILSVGIFLSA